MSRNMLCNKRNTRNTAARVTPLERCATVSTEWNLMPRPSPESLDKPRGQRFYEARRQARMTLDEVADFFGINRSTVLRWERGALPEKVSPPEIAERYQVRAAWLMHGDGPMKGSAATTEVPQAQAREHRSEPRLAIGQVNEVLAKAQATDGEREAAWKRLQSVEGEELTAEWLRGWVDGYRTGKGAPAAASFRPLVPAHKRSQR